jgi:prepilin-type N-terminal cleavage/methylation domain-containing protein
MKKSGFTLLELSIVLVIIGLIIGGITVGSALIEQAALKNIPREIENFRTAHNIFRLKYNARPGDMKNAIDYWGAAHAVPATCRTTVGTGTQTCNGNGNGFAESWSNSSEQFRYWQHLSNAGLLPGSYSGVSGINNSNHVIRDVNVPKGKYNDGIYNVQYVNPSPGDPFYFDGQWGQTLHFADPEITCANCDGDHVIMSSAALGDLDTKLDDGKPATGNIRAYKNNARPGCTDANTISANYKFQNSTHRDCHLIYMMNDW